MGLHVSDIIEGYSKAGKRVLKLLESAEEVPCGRIEDVRNEEAVISGLLAPLSAKQSGFEDMLAKLIAQTCIYVCPKDPTKFSVDNVRVAKVEGSGVGATRFMKGLVLTRDSMGTVKRVHDAKVAVFNCPLEHSSTETTGTVSITSAEQLKEFSVGEEKLLKESIEAVAEAGVNVVVASQTINDLALHFLERHGIFVLRVPSKFDLQRIARVCGARLMARLGAPMAEEMGHCPLVEVREVAGSKLTVFEQSADCPSKISTIIVRGATQSIMDDIERAIDDGVNTYRALCRDPRVIPGAGATEIELAMKIRRFGEETPGLDQYAIKKFAEALEIIPRTLAENSGMDGTETVTNLYNAHQAGKRDSGVDAEGLTIGDAPVLDAVITKSWGIRLAVDAALSVLRVDQIIMARPAGGPKPPGQR
jgi:T-complex protein 1 subunit theta